jgi:hypothetical protein
VNLRLRTLPLDALCASLVISASLLAHSQDTPAETAQPGQSAQSEQPQPNTNSTPAREEFVIDRKSTYRRFIEEVGGGDAEIQAAIEKGKQPRPQNFRSRLRIGEDDYKALYIIAVEAYRQLKANEAELDAGLNSLFGAKRERVPTGREELKAAEEKSKALGQTYARKNQAVIEDAMARAERELTKEGFRKADGMIYGLYGGGKTEYYYILRQPKQSPLPTTAGGPG